MNQRTLPALFYLSLILFSGGNLSCIRIKSAVWADIPFAISKSQADSCNTLSFATKQQSYDLVNCVSKLGFNDKYLIVFSRKSDHDTAQYWIIDKSIQSIGRIEKKENVEGPMDSTWFFYRKQMLHINNLQFTKEF